MVKVQRRITHGTIRISQWQWGVFFCHCSPDTGLWLKLRCYFPAHNGMLLLFNDIGLGLPHIHFGFHFFKGLGDEDLLNIHRDFRSILNSTNCCFFSFLLLQNLKKIGNVPAHIVHSGSAMSHYVNHSDELTVVRRNLNSKSLLFFVRLKKHVGIATWVEKPVIYFSNLLLSIVASVKMNYKYAYDMKTISKYWSKSHNVIKIKRNSEESYTGTCS